MDEARFAVYFSHSWHAPDVELNVQVWRELAAGCALLADAPEEPGAHPPYYINRIEELLRRTDLFVSVLTCREPGEGEFTQADGNLRCSPYSLFEIRLAERSDIPRLILYERGSGFWPPSIIRPWEAYVEFFCGRRERKIETQQWTTVIQPKIQQWIEWAAAHRRPISYERPRSAALIMSAAIDEQVYRVTAGCLRNFGYRSISCDPVHARASRIIRTLREAGLVVAEFGERDPAIDQLYAAAHGIGLPAIRMLRSGSGELPWILKGDPAGFEKDIVEWSKPQDLPAQIEPRIGAMDKLNEALYGDDAFSYLQSKRYARFYVFISHSLKGPDRVLVERIHTLLKARFVTPFEYHQDNTAGTDWREALGESLRKTTHFVALLDPEYEQSPTCQYELREVLKRRDKVKILPFMIKGREKPNPDLTEVHNELRSDPHAAGNAETVVQHVMKELDQALSRSPEA